MRAMDVRAQLAGIVCVLLAGDDHQRRRVDARFAGQRAQAEAEGGSRSTEHRNSFAAVSAGKTAYFPLLPPNCTQGFAEEVEVEVEALACRRHMGKPLGGGACESELECGTTEVLVVARRPTGRLVDTNNNERVFEASRLFFLRLLGIPNGQVVVGVVVMVT
jgi:hypothetical protein